MEVIAMKNIYLLLALITLGLCACTFPGVSESAPSEEQVQTAIAATRSASPSETPQPTFTETTAPTETDVPPEVPTEASLTCQVLDQYPDRLYCSGPSLESGKQVLVKVFEADSDEVLFEDEMLVPALPFAAPQPSRPGGGGGQPSRGGEPSRPYPYP
jgi:hypothetical protein